MSEPFNYQTTFILDKSHFNECYEESVPDKSFKDLYAKGGVLLLIGAVLVMFTELNPYASHGLYSHSGCWSWSVVIITSPGG